MRIIKHFKKFAIGASVLLALAGVIVGTKIYTGLRYVDTVGVLVGIFGVVSLAYGLGDLLEFIIESNKTFKKLKANTTSLIVENKRHE